MRLLHAYYDLRVAPLSFDFIWYLAIACAEAERQDAQLSVTLFYPYFRKSNAIEDGFTQGYQRWKLNNLLVRACHLCPRVAEVISNGTNRIAVTEPRYPESYHPNTVDLSSGLTPLPHTHLQLDAAMAGVKNKVILEPTEYANSWFRKKFGDKKVVVMPIRTTPHNAVRNSSMAVWYEVYARIRQAGYECVVIPDQDDYLNARTYTAYDWVTIEEASMDLDLRLSLYRNAFATVTWTGGATSPLLVSGATFIMFGIWNEASPVSSKSFFQRKGPTYGVQPRWFHPLRQRYDWTAPELLTPDYILQVALPWLRELESASPA